MNLVVGATGVLGGLIVHRLLNMGESVRALSRTLEGAQPLLAAGADVALGDLREPDTLVTACRCVRRVITTATAPLAQRHVQAVTDAIDWHGTARLIDAATSAGVEQFVYLSFLGASPGAPYPLAYAKGRSEVYLKESGLPYTIIAPVPFMETWIGFVLGMQLRRGPVVTLVGEGTNRLGFVSVLNVCDLVVAALGHPAAVNATLPLNGPTSYTYREVLALIEKAVGYPIRVQSVSAGGSVPGMPRLINELWAFLASMGDVVVNTTEIARLYALEMIPLEKYIWQTFAGGPMSTVSNPTGGGTNGWQ